LVSFQGVGIVPEGAGKSVNIRAKFSDRRRPDLQGVNEHATVNAPLGESYAAYWNWWLRGFAVRAERCYPDVFAVRVDKGNCGSDPMAKIDRLHRARGCHAIFDLARSLGRPSGFDVISLILTSSQTVPELVRRWTGLLSMQASLRCVTDPEIPAFLMQERALTLILSPYRIRPANRHPFGSAMLAGVATGTLESAGFAVKDIWAVPTAGAARSICRLGTGAGESMDFDSEIVVSLAKGEVSNPGPSRMPLGLGFRHLLDPDAAPRTVRLIARLVEVLEHTQGDHTALPLVASRLGLSQRSLSRRLTEAGIGYARLSRFVRLRKASRLLVAGDTCLDDIAFRAAYSDRHHLSRDFRKMAQVTPAGLRDLLAG